LPSIWPFQRFLVEFNKLQVVITFVFTNVIGSLLICPHEIPQPNELHRQTDTLQNDYQYNFRQLYYQFKCIIGEFIYVFYILQIPGISKFNQVDYLIFWSFSGNFPFKTYLE
jgi:hypothetical protein